MTAFNGSVTLGSGRLGASWSGGTSGRGQAGHSVMQASLGPAPRGRGAPPPQLSSRWRPPSREVAPRLCLAEPRVGQRPCPEALLGAPEWSPVPATKLTRTVTPGRPWPWPPSPLHPSLRTPTWLRKPSSPTLSWAPALPTVQKHMPRTQAYRLGSPRPPPPGAPGAGVRKLRLRGPGTLVRLPCSQGSGSRVWGLSPCLLSGTGLLLLEQMPGARYHQ